MAKRKRDFFIPYLKKQVKKKKILVTGESLFYKLCVDKILSLIFLIIISPVLLASFILIYIEDGLPIFFAQDRIGWDGKRFKIYKIRSLKNIKFKKTDQVQVGDSRLLKIGKFIRRYSIDEVPQFFNVLKGEMSIVRPRPHMVEHDIYFSIFLFYSKIILTLDLRCLHK